MLLAGIYYELAYNTMVHRHGAISGQISEAALKASRDKSQKELTTLRANNSKLGEERQRFAAIADNAPFGIIVLSRDGTTLYANPGHLGVVGSDGRQMPLHWDGIHGCRKSAILL